MADYTVGSVPYVNAAPLIGSFLLKPGRVKVEAAVPSSLPRLLASGEAQAILVSSIEALRMPGARIADRLGIISRGAVHSVRLFSKTPLSEIRTLAFDASSMTSNALALILLRRLHGISPQTVSCPPDQEAMLAKSDACVLIGDIGMLAPSEGLHVMDMGEAWTSMTGLPFVWAMWLGRDGLTNELIYFLSDALDDSGLGADSGRRPSEEHLILAAETSGWSLEMTREYLCQTMSYRLDEPAWEGLMEFRRGLIELDLLPPGADLPTRVSGSALSGIVIE